MSADNPTHEPGHRAGADELHLDTDRTRNELEDTLDEIERRLSPPVILASLKRGLTAHRVVTLAIGLTLVGATIGAMLWRTRRH